MSYQKAKQLRLSPELEKAVLAALIHGAVDLEAINPAELSPQGTTVYKAAKDLVLGGRVLPLALPEMLLVMTDVYGVPREQAMAWLEGIRAAVPAGGGAGVAVSKLRERYSLLTVANTASRQLQSGEYNPEKLFESVASSVVGAQKPTSLSAQIGDKMPDPPRRVPLRSLPRFSQRIGGGLVGLTVVSGEPAVGKSDFALQAAVEAQQNGPVLYYDLDNGLPTIVDKLKRMVGNDLTNLHAAGKQLFLRDSVRTLDSDLAHVVPPALVVVDIFQALPTATEYEREGLAHWIRRLGNLRGRGYVVLVVSEVNRQSYGNPGMGGFKSSGEIEYTADLAFQMTPHDGGAVVTVIKNRHSPFKGEAVILTRQNGLLWKEVEAW